MARITVNNKTLDIDAAPDTPLLWVLRDHLQMTGTKYGCGMALCGACTVHVDGAAVRSCVLPLEALEGKRITTIEGLSRGPQPRRAARMDRARRAAMRLLPVRTDHVGGRCCSRPIRGRAMPTSTPPWPATFAAAAPIGRIRKAMHRAAESAWRRISRLERSARADATSAVAPRVAGGGLVLAMTLPAFGRPLAARANGAARRAAN